MKFILYYSDKTQFEGNTFPKSQWNDGLDKDIIKLEYIVGKKKFVFAGFDEYNHLVENVCMLGKGSKITKVMIMARTKKETRILTIDLTENKIYHNTTEMGAEYGNQVLKGWKKGIAVIEPKAYLVQLT